MPLRWLHMAAMQPRGHKPRYLRYLFISNPPIGFTGASPVLPINQRGPQNDKWLLIENKPTPISGEGMKNGGQKRGGPPGKTTCHQVGQGKKGRCHSRWSPKRERFYHLVNRVAGSHVVCVPRGIALLEPRRAMHLLSSRRAIKKPEDEMASALE